LPDRALGAGEGQQLLGRARRLEQVRLLIGKLRAHRRRRFTSSGESGSGKELAGA